MPPYANTLLSALTNALADTASGDQASIVWHGTLGFRAASMSGSLDRVLPHDETFFIGLGRLMQELLEWIDERENRK